MVSDKKELAGKLAQMKRENKAESTEGETVQTTIVIDKSVRDEFKKNPMSLSAFVSIYGRKYLNGQL